MPSRSQVSTICPKVSRLLSRTPAVRPAENDEKMLPDALAVGDNGELLDVRNIPDFWI